MDINEPMVAMHIEVCPCNREVCATDPAYVFRACIPGDPLNLDSDDDIMAEFVIQGNLNINPGTEKQLELCTAWEAFLDVLLPKMGKASVEARKPKILSPN